MRLTLNETARFLKVPATNLSFWRRIGAIKTKGMKFEFVDVLACAVGRDLRQRKVDAEACYAAMAAVQSFSLKNLEGSFDAGRRYLVGVGDRFIPFLLTHERLFDNPSLPLQQAVESGLPVVILDLQKAFETLEMSLEVRGEPCKV